jgi:hypothetical protein
MKRLMFILVLALGGLTVCDGDLSAKGQGGSSRGRSGGSGNGRTASASYGRTAARPANSGAKKAAVPANQKTGAKGYSPTPTNRLSSPAQKKAATPATNPKVGSKGYSPPYVNRVGRARNPKTNGLRGRNRQQPMPKYHQPSGHQGPRHNAGYSHRGRHYRHCCFNGSWRDWTRRCWCPRQGIYIYWSPSECCWYRYLDSDQVFVPCDDLTSEDIDISSTVIVDAASRVVDDAD